MYTKIFMFGLLQTLKSSHKSAFNKLIQNQAHSKPSPRDADFGCICIRFGLEPFHSILSAVLLSGKITKFGLHLVKKHTL